MNIIFQAQNYFLLMDKFFCVYYLKVTVGMPPNNEHTITAPLPENELRQVIHEAYGDDQSTAMLSQVLRLTELLFEKKQQKKKTTRLIRL